MVDDTNDFAGTNTDQLLAETSDYWNKSSSSNLYNLIDIYNSRMGTISSNCQKVADIRSVDNATGSVLDDFGKDRDTYRVSNDDSLYRFMIYIKFMLAKANGTLPNIINISSTALSQSHELKVFQSGIRHIKIKLPLAEITDLKTEKLILTNLKQLVDLGIWLDSISFIAKTSSEDFIGLTSLSSEHVKLTAE